jgi:hypothetical protein
VGGNFTGAFKNESPAFSVGSLTGVVSDITGASANDVEVLLKTKIENNSFDLTSSNIKYGGFSGISFQRPDDFDSEFVYLFSFRKTQPQDGVLFGSLVKEDFDNGIVNFSYGKGFNVGINDRNQLFFQGIDSTIGNYVLTADQLELADENICSLKVSPYEVTFAHYNLADDEFTQQYLRTDSKIQNLDHTESLFIGGSPNYLRSGKTFSGFIDNLMIISGNYNPSDLKAISSGFVTTGIKVSGASYSDEVVTGHSITILTPIGVTGYQPVITGYQNVITTSQLIEFTLVEDPSPYSRNDGERFLTGYTLPNNSGSYIEETSFLIPNYNYRPTGDNAFATLNLRDSGDFVTRYTLSSVRGFNSTGVIPLYDLVPITGFLLNEPTGYEKTTLSTTILRTGNLVENLEFLDQYKGRFKKDFIYYLDKRI